ncbi:heparin lyase I family protein [Aquabacterium sp. A3]|uniref:heparin lyase I family protein n=1 Tax=Aquabacterium sp. A3 TaxID=3132829 RepID=UPI00311A60E3
MNYSDGQPSFWLRFAHCALAISAASLTACGGGGSSNESSTRADASGITSQDDLLTQAQVTDITSVVNTSGLGGLTSAQSQAPAISTESAFALLQNEDVLVSLRAGDTSATTVGRLQCMGQNTPIAAIQNGLYGSGADGITELKHGVVSDTSAANGANKTMLFRLWKSDPVTSGINTQRCERYFASDSQIIPQLTDIWFGVRLKTSEWDATSHRIVWQWHEDNAGEALLPHLAAIVNGTNLKIVAQFNDSGAPTRDNTSAVVLLSTDQWEPHQWQDFVVKANVDPSGSTGFVQIWLNGTKVVDYSGPFGYRYTNPRDYAKIGLYHWNTTTNYWHPGAPETIEASYSSMMLLKDSANYNASMVRALLY